MSDEQIAEQIIKASKNAVKRFHEATFDPNADTDAAVMATYLSGGNQMANFLCRTDGEVTPQQMERALKLAGERMGFRLGRPT